jgi:hypothetical protein
MSDDNIIVYPTFSTGKVEKPEVVLYTEDAQAKKFIDIQNDIARYVEEPDQWLHWNDAYWQNTSKLEVTETIRCMNRQDALDFQGQKTLRKQMCSRRFAQNVEGFARGDKRALYG